MIEQTSSGEGLLPGGSGTGSANIPAYQGGAGQPGAWSGANNVQWPGSPFPDMNPAARGAEAGSGVLHTMPHPRNAGFDPVSVLSESQQEPVFFLSCSYAALPRFLHLLRVTSKAMPCASVQQSFQATLAAITQRFAGTRQQKGNDMEPAKRAPIPPKVKLRCPYCRSWMSRTKARLLCSTCKHCHVRLFGYFALHGPSSRAGHADYRRQRTSFFAGNKGVQGPLQGGADFQCLRAAQPACTESAARCAAKVRRASLVARC